MRNLYSCGKDDFHCDVYRYDDSGDSQSNCDGIWFAIQEGKNTAYLMPHR